MKTATIRARGGALLGLTLLVSLVACTVFNTAKNSRPVANAGLDQPLAQVGQVVTLDGSASSDADGDTLAYRWAITRFPGKTPPALSDPETAKPRFAPSRAGEYEARLIVGDGKLDSDPATVLVTVRVEARNHPPRITSTPVTAATVGQAYRYDVDATDPDSGDTLAYSLTTAPSGMSISRSSGLIDWTPGAAGSFDVAVEVSDGKGGTARQPFRVAVVPVNASPKVNAGPDQAVTLPATANLIGTVTDDGLPNPPGAVTTSWSKQSGPGNVTFGNVSAAGTTAGFSEGPTGCG